MKQHLSCPACASRYTVYIQDVIGRRTKAKIPQFYCMDCSTFFNFSGYRETDSQKKSDFEYLIKKQEHIAKLQNRLVMEICNRAPNIKSCCEIGFGTGLFLKACTYFGIQEYGFETNPYAANYAKEIVGVRCEEGLFTRDHAGTYDLIAAIGVLEHLENPRELFENMARHLNPDGVIYVNVPFVERRDWKFLWNADQQVPDGPPDPFYDNDVHIIHYSVAGLKLMGTHFGAKSADYFISKDVSTGSAGAYPGILFQF